MNDRSRQFRADSLVKVLQIEHRNAFNELAHIVYASEPPPGGWPPRVAEKIAECKAVSDRLRDATRSADRLSSRGG